MWSRENVRSSIIGIVALAVLLLIAHGASAQSSESSHAPVVANGSSADTDFPAWDSFTDELHQLGTRIIARLPERLRNDPQVRQEAGRLLLEALAAKTIEAISADGDHPVFLPASNVTLNIGQPNADTTYRSAAITPGGVYRLRGGVGSLRSGSFLQTPAWGFQFRSITTSKPSISTRKAASTLYSAHRSLKDTTATGGSLLLQHPLFLYDWLPSTGQPNAIRASPSNGLTIPSSARAPARPSLMAGFAAWPRQSAISRFSS